MGRGDAGPRLVQCPSERWSTRVGWTARRALSTWFMGSLIEAWAWGDVLSLRRW